MALSPAPSPAVSIGATPLNILYGESGVLVLSFDEQTTVGYGPWLQLLLPAPSNHLQFGAASWAGGSLSAQTLNFSGPNPAGLYTLTHPYTGQTLTGSKGDQLLIWKFPIGSYAADAPPLELRVPVAVAATTPTLGPVAISVGGGYALGADPQQNPNTDPALQAPALPGAIVPAVVQLDKDPISPEYETATGPNFGRQWRLSVNGAAGQTLKDLTLSDSLPNGPIYLGTDPEVVNLPGALAKISSEPKLNAATAPGNNQLQINYGTVTGLAAQEDLRAEIRFYIPQTLNQASGVPITYANSAKLSGTWTNPPQGAPGAVEVQDQDPEPETITAKALAIQKYDDRPETLDKNGRELAGTILPGEIVNFTLDFQVSDYFAFGELKIEDILGDGLSFLPGTAKIRLQEQGNSLTNGGFVDYLDGYLAYTKDFSLGKDRLQFDLSAWLKGAGLPFADDGILQGGYVGAKAGASLGRITFQAKVDDLFVAPQLAGQNIKAADNLRNDVTFEGQIYSYNPATASFTDTNVVVTDTSSEALRIPEPSLVKSIVARNGQPLSGAVVFAPGDTVTYRLRAVLPTGDLQAMELLDWLPTPGFSVANDAANGVFKAAFEAGGSGATAANPPAAGRFAYGSEHSAPQLQGNQLQVGPGTNQLLASFPNTSDQVNKGQVVDLYYTVTATAAVMADRLEQTNISQLNYSSSDGVKHSTDLAVAIGERLSPDLKIRKGVVSTSRDKGQPGAGNIPASYSPAINTDGVIFALAGSAGAPFSGGSGNGILSSSAISTAGENGSTGAVKSSILDSNVSNLDAGDLVRFAIVIENIGTSYRGAFDVQLRDELPPGLSYAGNLSIVDGTGVALAYTKPDGSAATAADFFSANGVMLTDPGATPASGGDGLNGGAIDGYSASSGRNIAVVVFDAVVDTSAYGNLPIGGGSLINKGILEDYANVQTPGASTFLPGLTNLNDLATVNLRKGEITKSVVSTSEASTSGNNVAIGEIVRYRLQVNIPEGELKGFQVSDVLPAGLSFLNDGTAKLALVGSSVNSFSWTLADPIAKYFQVSSGDNTLVLPSQAAPAPTINGQALTWSLGTLGDLDRDNNVTESVVLEFNARVDNIASNKKGTSLKNIGRFNFDGISQQSASMDVVVVEPQFTIQKSVTPTGGMDAGDLLTYTVVIKNTGNADAFDLQLDDSLGNLGVNFDLQSVTIAAAPASTNASTAGSVTSASNAASGDRVQLTAAQLKVGESLTLSYSGVLLAALQPGTRLTNEASIRYSSLPGERGTTVNPTGSSIPGDSGAATGERNGSGGFIAPNNYFNASSVAVESLGFTAQKTVRLSSEDSTQVDNVAIGEIVRFRLQAQLPEGSISTLQFVDDLPAGFEFINDGTATLGFAAGSATDLSWKGGQALGDYYLQAVGTNTTLVPTKAFAPSLSNNNKTLAWALGDVVNRDRSNLRTESVIAEFNARVSNIIANQAGTALINTAKVTRAGNYSESFSAPKQLLVEPNVRLTKTASAPPAAGFQSGDPVTYTISLNNSGGASAFDLQVEDLLDQLGSSFDLRSVALGSIPGAVDQSISSGSSAPTDRVSVAIPRLDPGQTVSFTYTGLLTAAAQINSSYANTAKVTWTSLPAGGTPVGSVNQTGSAAGIAGTASGERTGSDGLPTDSPTNANPLNNYVAKGSATIDTRSITFKKSIVLTSEPDSVGSNVYVGEIIRYRLQADLPGGTSTSVLLTDLLPQGLSYVPGSAKLALAAQNVAELDLSGLSNEVDYYLPASGANTGLPPSRTYVDPINGVWSFGTIVNSNASDAQTESLILEFDALVANQKPPNVAGFSYGNTASLEVGNFTGTKALKATAPLVTLREPLVTLSKQADKDCLDILQNPLDNKVVYKLVFTNTGSATAFDLDLRDVLPSAANGARLDLQLASIASESSGGASALQLAPDNGPRLLHATVARLPVGASVTVTYTALLSDGAAVVGSPDVPNGALVNGASITYTSLPGNQPNERSGIDGLGTGVNNYAATKAVAVNVHSAATTSGALVVDEDNLPGAGGEGPNTSIGLTSSTKIALSAGSFGINTASLKLGSSTVALAGSVASVSGLALVDANGVGITADANGRLIRWDYGIVAARTLRAYVETTPGTKVGLLELLFPTTPAIAAASTGSLEINAKLLGALQSHGQALADNNYSQQLLGSWKAAVKLQGIELLLGDGSAGATEACDDLAIPLLLTILDDIPTSPAITGDTAACFGGWSKSGSFVIQPGADNGVVGLVVDANGNGSFDADVILKATNGSITDLLQRSFVVAGKGELLVSTNLAAGSGSWTFIPAANGAAQTTQTFSIGVRDADGDIKLSTHSLVLNTKAAFGTANDRELILNEDALANAGGENATAATYGFTDTAQLVIQSGSLATTAIGFDTSAAALGAIQLLRSGQDVTANLVAPTANSLYSFAVSSGAGLNDTLTLLWAGKAVARLKLAATNLTIAAGQSGLVSLGAELLGPMPTHLLKNQDGGYQPLIFEGLPLILQSAEGCAAPATVSLSVYDDRPALRVVNSSGFTSSTVAANGSIAGSWGRSLDATGGYGAAVGADVNVYANADFSPGPRWEVLLNGITYSSAQAASGIAVTAADGTALGRLVLQAAGIWSFNSLATVFNQEQFSFSVRVLDADGDARNFNHRITVVAANAPQMLAPQLNLDEDNLLAGAGEGPNTTVGLTDIQFVELTAKSAAINSLVFAQAVIPPVVLDANGLPITGLVWSRSLDSLSLTASYGGIDVLRLSLPASVFVAAGTTGQQALTATLLAALPSHLKGSADNDYSRGILSASTAPFGGAVEITGVELVATASNGQTAHAIAGISILDDMASPLALQGGGQISFGAVAPLTGSFLVNPGADNGSLLVTVLAGGQVLQLDPASAAGFLEIAGLGRLDLQVDFGAGIGSWSFTVASTGAAASQTSFSVSVQDADGDRRLETHAIAIALPAAIDLGAGGGLLVLNEDALAIPLVGPDSPYTSSYDNRAAKGAQTSISIQLNGDQVQGVSFDPSRLAAIQSGAPGLSYQLVDQNRSLLVFQAAAGAAGLSQQVARVSLGNLDYSLDPLRPRVTATATLFSNLISHGIADNFYAALDINQLPILLEQQGSSSPPVTELLSLRIYDDVGRVGIADAYADPGEAKSVRALSGLGYVDEDTQTTTGAGGQVRGTWGALAGNNGGTTPQASLGSAAAFGADGLGAGPALAAGQRWELWVDVNRDGLEEANEQFSALNAAALDGTGAQSGLEIPGMGWFKFWDTQASKAAGWAFKASPDAAPGALDFRVSIVDADGDRDSQTHTLRVGNDVGQKPTVNLYLLMDDSVSMQGSDPSTQAAAVKNRLEAQNRLAFIALQDAAQLAGYGYYTDANSPFYNFDDSSINNVLTNGAGQIASALGAYQLADDPADGILAGRVNVHVIKFGYLVEYSHAVFDPTSVDQGIAIAQQVLTVDTNDKLFGNSIVGNPDWQARGLPAPGPIDYYQDPALPASNLYAGTEMLGALQGFQHLLAAQERATNPNSDEYTLLVMTTDGRPERRYWWDNRPELGYGGTAVKLPTELGGDPILSSGLLYDSNGNVRYTPTAAGVDQWTITQKAMNASLNALAAKLDKPATQLVVNAVGMGDGSNARFPQIYNDLFTQRSFDNSASTWTYQWTGSGSLPSFLG